MSLIIDDAMVYVGAAGFKGRVESVELPDIEFDAIDISPLGLLGQIKAAGRLQALEGVFTLYGYDPELLAAISNPRRAETVLLRSAQEIQGPSGLEREVPVAWTLQPRFLKQGLGELGGGDGLQRKFEFTTNTLLVEIDGVERLNIDVFDYVFAVDGENVFKDKRAALGLD